MSLLADTLAMPGLWLLVGAAVLAGLVRGFTGFGTAMVYLPVAGQVLDPVAALVTLVIIDFIGPIPAVPRAVREGHPRDVLRLVAGLVVGAPVGVAVLLILSPDVFRTAVSVIALGLLAALVSGFRYHGTVTRPMIYAIGALAGLLHGAAGLPGPPVILLYMARPLPVQVIRASVLLFLFLADIVVFTIFGLRGLLTAEPVLVGIVLILPYLAAVMVGSRLFDPKHAQVYRWTAYAIIAASAVSGLPFWD
ncbi:sulfite exporter TauE/SafE family protein [Psychromarinibacter sp. C21-152]|uniref:Probable membrane transporter protein n=1 Tax=Psychromarinibacter sediminicola TaxID=3033385 RepID=A0AAE3NTQ8_9RHOB|nr:sulfite exporter TauE/SafE family protein [Psychromarinibacter sediminicola]MDF0601484.1 sulfite exporter TauE/SafE family protein [Psychromarinibacter sediminicola]